MSSNGTLLLGEVRARAATALAPLTDDDPTVLVNLVDAVQPPALMLEWDDPWLEAETFGRALWFGNLVVLCLAARVQPGPGVEKLEQLAAYTIGRLQADTYPWPVASLQAPRVFTIGNVPLLGARVGYRVPVTV